MQYRAGVARFGWLAPAILLALVASGAGAQLSDQPGSSDRAPNRVIRVYGTASLGDMMLAAYQVTSSRGQRSLPTLPNGYQNTLGVPADRYVTLSVPPDRPIPLSQAIQRIATQTRFPVRLDPRVPRDVLFTGDITQAPLPLALQNIAETAGLKVLANGMQAVLVPADHFQILYGNVIVAEHPSVPCRRCGQPLAATWAFCPHCGAPTARAEQAPGGTRLRPGGRKQE
jgi:hypothetical protein